MNCLFCGRSSPDSVEHIIPESLGNDDVILTDQVCISCNNYFSKIEKEVLDKTPMAFWRVYLGIKTKKGKMPFVDLSQKTTGGMLPKYHPLTDKIGFKTHSDFSTEVLVHDKEIFDKILSGKKEKFRLVLTPHILVTLGQFLCKIGVELLALEDADNARSPIFYRAIEFARRGMQKEMWPIYHYSQGSHKDFFAEQVNGRGESEETVRCFSYSILKSLQADYFLRFQVGTDNWIVCLNDDNPSNEFASENDFKLLWYPRHSF